MCDFTLAPPRTIDARTFHAAVRESLPELCAWMPWARPEYSLDEARQFLESREQAATSGTEYTFAIVRSDGAYAGVCGISQINRVNKFANLGYWVRTSMVGRGAAAAAVHQVTDWAFANTGLVRLEIVCAVGNLRSQRTAERAGAIREGVLRHRLLIHGHAHDAVMYAILRSARRDDGVLALP